jgi:hypothetical protein
VHGVYIYNKLQIHSHLRKLSKIQKNIMASSIYMFFFIRLLFLLSLLHLILTHSPPFMKPLCHDDESSALLQFKEGFVIDKSASPYYPLTCQKVASWALEGDKSDCCSWDGVECDEDTGHVIGLDLSSSCLYGSINSSSSLFRLVHLKRLNLAYNHFNFSPIPPQVRNLSKLTYLNLTASMFSGQIPSEISHLSHLTSLHLCYNYDLYSGKHLLELRKPDLTKSNWQFNPPSKAWFGWGEHFLCDTYYLGKFFFFNIPLS